MCVYTIDVCVYNTTPYTPRYACPLHRMYIMLYMHTYVDMSHLAPYVFDAIYTHTRLDVLTPYTPRYAYPLHRMCIRRYIHAYAP